MRFFITLSVLGLAGFLLAQAFSSKCPALQTAAHQEAQSILQSSGPQAVIEAAELLERKLSNSITRPKEIEIQNTITAYAETLALAPDAELFAWDHWVHSALLPSPWTAKALLMASSEVLEDRGVSLADSLDRPMTSTQIRLEAHRILWAQAPGIAIARANRLFFSGEKARGNEQIRALYLRGVLPKEKSVYVLEFLVRCASHSPQDSWTRLQAVRLLVDLKHQQAAQTLAGIYLSNSEDLNLRMEAFKGALALDPSLGHRFLMERVPNAANQPGLYEFFRLLRVQEGLPPLPAVSPTPEQPK